MPAWIPGAFILAAPGTIATSQGIIFPESYNTAGDWNGSTGTDDTVAMQNAFNAAAAAGKQLYVTRPHRITGQLTMPAGLDLRLAISTAALVKDYTTSSGTTSSFLISDMGLLTKTGTTTSASAIITGLPSTADLAAGRFVTGAGIPSGATILTVDSSTQVTLTLPATASATVTLSFIRKANSIRITGPGSIYASSTSMKGNIICVFGDDFVASEFRITCWSQGRAIAGVGDRWRHSNYKVTGSDGLINSGGMRYQGGDSSVFLGIHVESGDDCLQMAPVGNASDPLFDQSITRCSYLACTGRSSSARFMVVVLKAAAGPGGMTSSVTDGAFVSCRGFGNTRAMYILNRDSSGDIDNITSQDCSVDTINSANIVLTNCSITSGSPIVTAIDDTSILSVGLTVAGTGITGGTTIASIDSGSQITLSLNATATSAVASLTFGGYGQTVLINRSSGTTAGVLYYAGVGAVKNIYLRRLMVKNAVGTNCTIGTAGLGIQNIYIEDPALSSSPNASTAVVNILGVTTMRVVGGSIDAGGRSIDGVLFGGTTAPNADIEIRATRIIGLANTQFGVNWNATVSGRQQGTRIEQFSGQVTAKAWKVSASSSGIKITGNDFNQLSNAVKFTDLAADTENADNLGDSSAYGSPFSPSTLSYITARWYTQAGAKATVGLGAGTINKVYAMRIPSYLWGKTVTAYGINQTVAPIVGTATAVIARFALTADSAGSPATAIVVGSEGTIDVLTGAPTGGLATGAVSSVIPTNGWVLFVVQPNGTLGTYPTYDTLTSTFDGMGFPGATPATAVVSGYSESGQTTTATMVGATLPAIVSTFGTMFRLQLKVT